MLPDWKPGTPAILCAAGPHAIPVSTAIRAGDDRVLLALAAGRATLARLREDHAAALCLLGERVAFTAHGRAAVVRDGLEAAPGVVAVELRIERVQDHLADGRTEMVDGARWRWREERFAESERRVLGELRRLAS